MTTVVPAVTNQDDPLYVPHRRRRLGRQQRESTSISLVKMPRNPRWMEAGGSRRDINQDDPNGIQDDPLYVRAGGSGSIQSKTPDPFELLAFLKGAQWAFTYTRNVALTPLSAPPGSAVPADAVFTYANGGKVTVRAAEKFAPDEAIAAFERAAAGETVVLGRTDAALGLYRPSQGTGLNRGARFCDIC